MDELTTTKRSPVRCQTENTLAEELGLVQPESITEVTNAETKVIGYSVRKNGSGWTPSASYSSLNVDFRHPVEVGQQRRLQSRPRYVRLTMYVFLRLAESLFQPPR